MCSPLGHQDQDEFVSYPIFRNVIASVSQQWMLCSEWVPSEWVSNENITIMYMYNINICV